MRASGKRFAMSATRIVAALGLVVVVTTTAGRAAGTLDVTWQPGSDDRILSWSGTCGSAITIYRGVDDPCVPPAILAIGVTGNTYRDLTPSPGVDRLIWYQVGCEDAGIPGPPDSNRAFAVERSLPVVASFENAHVVSVPTRPGLADRGGDTPSRGCVEDGSLPDGVLTALDVACSFWDGQGQIAVSRFDASTRTFVSIVAANTIFGRRFAGVDTPLVPGEALLINVAGAARPRGFITGTEDAAFPGMTVAPTAGLPGTWQLRLLSVPEDAPHRSADAFLCGVPGTDWIDGDGDGAPDTCPSGLFDGTHAISVQVFDNVPDGSPTDNRWIVRTVQSAGGRLVFLGTNFTVQAGAGILVDFDDDQLPAIFLPPRC